MVACGEVQAVLMKYQYTLSPEGWVVVIVGGCPYSEATIFHLLAPSNSGPATFLPPADRAHQWHPPSAIRRKRRAQKPKGTKKGGREAHQPSILSDSLFPDLLPVIYADSDVDAWRPQRTLMQVSGSVTGLRACAYAAFHAGEGGVFEV